jgi:hypothetical protein
VDFTCLQRCPSIVVAVANLYGPVATRLRTEKSAGALVSSSANLLYSFRYGLKLRTLHYLCTFM